MKKLLWAVLPVYFLISGCNTSRLTTSWTKKDFTYKEYEKILVVGLINNADRSIQDRMEKHMAGDLNTLGYKAITSLEEYGPKAFENLKEEDVLKKTESSGVDAVCTIVLLDLKKEKEYIPPRAYYSRDFWDYYNFRFRRIYEPGYYVTSTKYFWESNFYDLKNKTLIYSAQTQSFSPASTENLAHTYGLILIKDMQKKRVLKEGNLMED